MKMELHKNLADVMCRETESLKRKSICKQKKIK